MRKELYHEQFEEEKLACKERAGWQCEAILPWTGKRCPAREGDILWSRRSGRNYIVYLHAAHLNNDPQNPKPDLICLCPGCHMRFDRNKEQEVQPSQRRRGYELTSTDRLVAAVGQAGLTVTPISEGYHWQLAGTEFEGTATTALNAVSHAIGRMRTEIAFLNGTTNNSAKKNRAGKRETGRRKNMPL